MACCGLEAARVSATPSLPVQASSPGGGRVQLQAWGELVPGVMEGRGGSWKLREDQGWCRDPGSETMASAAGLSSRGGGAEEKRSWVPDIRDPIPSVLGLPGETGTPAPSLATHGPSAIIS